MKLYFNLILAFIFSSSVSVLYAQEFYSVDGQNLQLEKTVEGPLTLLWTKHEGKNRYFLKKDNEITELTNTQGREEFKKVLTAQTYNRVSTSNLKLNLRSLSNFFTAYNNEINQVQKSNLETRLGIFAGIDNTIYTYNPTNVIHPKIGAEFELIESNLLRHALVVEANYTFKSNEHRYNSFQLSLNYRFKFVQTSKFDAYINAKLVTYTSSKIEYLSSVSDGDLPVYNYESHSSSGMAAPVIFGLGADYRVGDGFITFGYNDLVAIDLKSNKKFPVNFSLGYKFML